MTVTKEELYLFMKRYDTDYDGSLTFGNFSEAIAPITKKFAKHLYLKCPDIFNW